ncbi:MAG: DUF1905 domain-containing protein [Acidimicrobiales bacterium]
MAFAFDAELFEWDARTDASWVFAMVPVEVAEEIRDMTPPRRGFGSVRVHVRIGGSEWLTSVFPDSGSGSYVLPVKNPVRKAENIEVGDTVAVELEVVLADL